jgi:hypothetical protein
MVKQDRTKTNEKIQDSNPKGIQILLDWDDQKMKCFANYVKGLTSRQSLEMIGILTFHITVSESMLKDYENATTEEDKSKYVSLMEDMSRLTKVKLAKYNFPKECFPD